MAQGKGRWIRAMLGVVFAVVGFFCLNYTKAPGVEYHVKWAREEGMPEPTYSIYLMGVILLPIGAGLVGHSIRGCCTDTKTPA